MSVKHINKGEVINEADAHTQCLNKRIADLSGVKSAVNEYISDSILVGSAYSGSKNYMRSYYLPMYTSLESACAEMIVAHNLLKSHLAIVIGDDINVPETERARDHHRERANHFEAEADIQAGKPITSPAEIAVKQWLVLMLRNQARFHKDSETEMTKVLDSVRMFETRVPSIYNHPNNLFSQIEAVQAQLGSVGFCGIGLSYTLPAGLDAEMSRMFELSNRADIEAAMAELKLPDGSYNWDLIEEWMHTDPRYITQARLFALIQTYIELECVLDVERFINAGYNGVTIRDGREVRTEYIQTAVFKIVSDTVLSIIRPQIRQIEASNNPFSELSERLLCVKFYELQNDINRRIVNGFLEPIRDANLSEDILEIKFIMYKAPEPYKSLVLNYLPNIGIIDNQACTSCRLGLEYRPHDCKHNLDRAQHYNSGELSIFVNFSNLRCTYGYLTFFHEVGHAIDFAMGEGNKYASAVFFNDLEREVRADIMGRIHAHTGHIPHAQAIQNAFMYDGNPNSLTPDQEDIYIALRDEYRVILDSWHNNPQNGTASMIFGGFTQNVLIIDRTSGDRIGRGHESLDYYYDTNKGEPTGAQNRELFADHIAVNLLNNTDRVNANSSFFPYTTAKMDEMIQNDLRMRG